MKQKIFPNKLKKGDTIAVIAPSRSMAIISQDTQRIANKNLEDLGFKLVFGEHVNEFDRFVSSSIESRVKDLHWAFANPEVKAVLTVIGGYNCNQLLSYIDWDLIKKNPKIFCGYSDITILNDSFLAQAGLVTYYGPHYSTFGQKYKLEYAIDYFKKCLMSNEPFDLFPSKEWADDQWWLNQENRVTFKNPGYEIINRGEAQGIIIGGNLGTFTLLQGTEYFPSLKNSILFLEDDVETPKVEFIRRLQSLIQQPGFDGVKGIVFGRFQHDTHMDLEELVAIVRTIKELNFMPIIANVDFGHTNPIITFPIGGEVTIKTAGDGIEIKIQKH
ncbi:MAG: Peptidase U61 LD-carboxypeptidase A [candidate division TM6 bacterium GW2011_GWF2_32_72]|nr:MAG: Peptidase U61 LD-carboxypeptidase A [candidate division TM6 bacterium GW2011_GWF2_32_72]